MRPYNQSMAIYGKSKIWCFAFLIAAYCGLYQGHQSSLATLTVNHNGCFLYIGTCYLFDNTKKQLFVKTVFYDSHSFSSTGLHLRSVNQPMSSSGAMCDALQMFLIEVKAFQWALSIGYFSRYSHLFASLPGEQLAQRKKMMSLKTYMVA